MLGVIIQATLQNQRKTRTLFQVFQRIYTGQDVLFSCNTCTEHERLFRKLHLFLNAVTRCPAESFSLVFPSTVEQHEGWFLSIFQGGIWNQYSCKYIQI